MLTCHSERSEESRPFASAQGDKINSLIIRRIQGMEAGFVPPSYLLSLSTDAIGGVEFIDLSPNGFDGFIHWKIINQELVQLLPKE